MAFFVYIAILLVAISGILLELDWLTKPKLDSKSPIQTATAVLPSTQPAKPKAKSGEVNPKNPDVARVVAPPPPPRQPAETTGNAPTDNPPANAPAVTAGNAPQPQSNPQPQSSPAPTAPVATADEPAKTESAPPPPAPSPPAQPANIAPQHAGVAPPNTCDVQGCMAAYTSFRASDCTYQPYEGPRRVCEKPPAPRSGEQTAHRRSKDDALRDVEASVRRLRPVAADRDDVDDDDADDASAPDGRRVIVIERPAHRGWPW